MISIIEFAGLDIVARNHPEIGAISSVVFCPYFFTMHNEAGRCHVRVTDRSVSAKRCGVAAKSPSGVIDVVPPGSERWRTLQRDAFRRRELAVNTQFLRVRRIAQPNRTNAASAPLRLPGG